MNHNIKMAARSVVHKSALCAEAYRILSRRRIHRLSKMSDEQFLKKMYKENTGHELNLAHPVTFNEKILWLNLHDHNPLYTKFADKYAVRGYVMDKLQDERYLVPLIGVYNSIEEVPFDKLPEEYVIKCTHDCGSVVVKRKGGGEFDVQKVKKKIKDALAVNYYYVGRIWCYKHIKPRIIVEEVIATHNNEVPKDYKIFCFHGKPKFLFVASDRGKDTKFDFFDLNWNRLPVKQHYPNSTYKIPRPVQLDEMLECAEKLSAGVPHVRVDFYIDKFEHVKFGELTMCQFAGTEEFEPYKYNIEFGNYIKLPGKK